VHNYLNFLSQFFFSFSNKLLVNNHQIPIHIRHFQRLVTIKIKNIQLQPDKQDYQTGVTVATINQRGPNPFPPLPKENESTPRRCRSEPEYDPLAC
jgi:hypothetical protein